MSFIELKLLILALIGIDIAIIIFFVFLIRKLRSFNSDKSFHKGTKIFESLLIDADKISGQLREELEEKHQLIKGLNEKLDKRIMSLNVLLNRADAALSSYDMGSADANDKLVSLKSQEKEILRLAREGCDLEKTARILSIPKGKVKLVLDLKKKLSRLRSKEGVP